MQQLELIQIEDVSRRISLSETQIRNLRSLGVLNSTSYIYLAIKVMEEESKHKYVNFNLIEFADRWHLRLIEIRKTLIVLEDKGLISSDFADAHVISAI